MAAIKLSNFIGRPRTELANDARHTRVENAVRKHLNAPMYVSAKNATQPAFPGEQCLVKILTIQQKHFPVHPGRSKLERRKMYEHCQFRTVCLNKASYELQLTSGDDSMRVNLVRPSCIYSNEAKAFEVKRV
jgi:hypothetical protein